jgi:hypothetical protein
MTKLIERRSAGGFKRGALLFFGAQRGCIHLEPQRTAAEF